MAPSINAGSGLSVNLKRSTNQNNQISSGQNYSSNMYLNGSLNLFSGLKTINTIKAQKILQRSVKEQTEQLKNDLFLDVLVLYANIVYELERIKISKNKLLESETQLERIAALVEVGKREPVAIDEIKATVSGAQLELTRAKNRASISQIRLMNLVEFSGQNELQIKANDFSIIKPTDRNYTTTFVYTSACETLPRLKKQELLLSYISKQICIQYGQILPTLSIHGGYGSGYYSTDTLLSGQITPFGQQFKEYLNPSLGMSLSIPLFNGRRKEFDLRRKKLDKDDQLIAILQEKNTIQKEVEEAIQLLQSSQMEYKNAMDYLGFVEKSYLSNKEKYALGLLNSTDFLSAQNQLADAQLSVINSKLNWIVQDKIIQLYTGNRTY